MDDRAYSATKKTLRPEQCGQSLKLILPHWVQSGSRVTGLQTLHELRDGLPKTAGKGLESGNVDHDFAGFYFRDVSAI